jgi:hypothetical protein
MHCTGYTPMPARTGYERVIAYRTDDLFAKIAEEEGVVEKITDTVITVRYKSGETDSFEIGRRFGKFAGDTVPHTVVTELTEGQKFKKGQFLVYNKEYFEVDKLDPTQLMYKQSVLARVVLMETTDTFEDSCAISTEFAKKMETSLTHIRTIKVAFEQEVRNLLQVGTTVDHESILCTLQNPNEGNKQLFDEKALETLKAISSLTPKAKFAGVIEKIEVLYTGEITEMSESLRAITDKSDRSMIKTYKQMGKPAVNGQVDPGFRVDGVPMDMDTVAIRVFITGPVAMGVGDKGVFANQMKSIVARMLTGRNQTQDGQPIDAIFSYDGFMRRIVLSGELMGTLNTLLVDVSKKAVEAYRKK